MEIKERQELVSRMVNVSYLIKKQQESILMTYGITLQNYHVLLILSSRYPEGLSQTDIRQQLNDKTVDLPRIITRLDQNALISYVRRQDSKGRWLIIISPKGIDLLKQIEQQADAMSMATLQLTDEEILTMKALLVNMETQLKKGI